MQLSVIVFRGVTPVHKNHGSYGTFLGFEVTVKYVFGTLGKKRNKHIIASFFAQPSQ